jgi:GNAT superfamily N-acetyltransferase
MALPLQLMGDVRRRRVRHGGSSIELIEVGREKLLRPIGAKLFGELPEPTRELPRALWSPAAVSQGSTADMVLAEVHRWMAPRFRRAGWVIVPQSVRWHGELAAIPPKDCSHGLLDNMRKIRRQNLTVEQGTSSSDWKEFFETMALPQALSRHGPEAWRPSPQLREEFSKVGILQLVVRDGVRVGGVCTVSRGDTLWLAISGVRQGDPRLQRQGVGFAILALTIEWARQQGYRFLDAGRTGPFVNDGLHQFKRRWGLSPVLDPLAHVAAVWTGSLEVREAFARQPVLVESGEGLRVYAGE